MNNLFRHIEYLILHHDCVIVPGLGAFIATRQPAHIDFQKGVVIPPSRTVMFNQAVTLDDGLLANSYARKYSLSFEEARQIILREVASLKSTLLASREVQVSSLGLLMLGEEERVLFFPCDPKSEIEKKLGFHPVSVTKPMKEEVHDTAVAAFDGASQGESKGKHPLRFNISFGKIAVALAIFATVALAVIFHPTPQDSREQRASVVPVEALMPSAPRSDLKKEAQHEIIKPALTDPSPVVEEAAAPQPAFYLIVATFSTIKEAERFRGKYSSADYPLEVITSKTLTRVAVASSADKASLQRQLNSPAITSRFPNAWIWTR